MPTDRSSPADLRSVEDLPPFMPHFTDEEGFAAEYRELFADPQLRLMKVEGFGPLKLAIFRNGHLRRLMTHPALAGNLDGRIHVHRFRRGRPGGGEGRQPAGQCHCGRLCRSGPGQRRRPRRSA